MFSVSAAKKMKLTAVEETGYLKSQFYKKSSRQKSQTQSTHSPMCPTNDTDIEETKGDNSGADLNENFKFRFNISDDSSDNLLNSISKGENEICVGSAPNSLHNLNYFYDKSTIDKFYELMQLE